MDSLSSADQPSSSFKALVRQKLQVLVRGLLGLEKIDFSVLDRLIQDLSAHQGRCVVTGVGKSGHIARKLASSMTSVGLPAIFMHPTEAAHGDLGLLVPGDFLFVLSSSGYTQELMPVIDHASHLGNPIVALTSDKHSSLALASSYPLIIPSVEEICSLGLAPTTSPLVMLALGDLIMVLAAERRSFSAESYKTLHPAGNLGFKLLCVKDKMHQRSALPLVRSETPMSEAILVMTEKKLGVLLVVDEARKLLGILTDGDLRRAMAPELLDRRVGDLMCSAPLCCDALLPLEKAMEMMKEKRVGALCVTDKRGVIEGLLHWQDCLALKGGDALDHVFKDQV